MEIYIIRHTTPSVATDICYGQSDIELAATFEDEAMIIRNKLDSFNPDIIYSSPLKRCHRLAGHLFPQYKAIIHNDLIEMNFGQWELISWNEIPLAELQPWMDNFYHQAPPRGESFIALTCRVEHFLNELAALPDDSKIAIITHSGCIRAMLMQWMAIPHTHIFNLRLQYGVVIRTTIHGNAINVQFL